MTNLNSMLYDEFDKMGVFTTCLISKVNTAKNVMSVSNAGHYSPIIIEENGVVCREIECKKGIPIGIMDDAEYGNNTFKINKYPMICMYTDGVLEIKNETKEEYGTSRLEGFLKENFNLKPEHVIDNLKVELKEFAGKDSYDDDILVVMLKDK
ncbi:hypothetical protein SDC9_123662 [bioreactor metagenome]|uniref:PPM-type phosphatase domain-containing protein n=2 Tax=root TaxID=1 RepID=A0A645CI98_9ZZZZ